MLTQQYSEQQRRAVNLVWTAAADYRFEPRFLALRTDGAPDFYMNCVIGYVHKWFGDDMPARLFASWAGDVRQAMLDDLAWLALENAAYERELPQRPALEELRAAHAAEFFSMEYQLSRQEWMNKNQLVYTLQSARWKGVLGERPPALNPWEKKLSRALACPGTLSADELERAIRDAFRTYLQFDGTVHKKTPLRLHFDERWVPLLTKLLPTEIVRTDDLAIGRSAHAGQGGMVEAANALRADSPGGPPALDRAGGDGPRLHRELLRPQHLRPAAARPHRAAALHRKPPRLPPVVHARHAAGRPAAGRRGGASCRAGGGAGAAQPRRLRQGQRTLSERAAAPDRADPQLHACPPPAGRRPRAAGTARRRACLA